MIRKIGGNGSYNCSLLVKREDGKCFRSNKNYDGVFWEEIPEYLYDSLNKFQNEQDKKESKKDD